MTTCLMYLCGAENSKPPTFTFFVKKLNLECGRLNNTVLFCSCQIRENTEPSGFNKILAQEGPAINWANFFKPIFFSFLILIF